MKTLVAIGLAVLVAATADASAKDLGTPKPAHSVQPTAAATAAKAQPQRKFTPTKLSGQSVKVTGTIQYNFVAQ